MEFDYTRGKRERKEYLTEKDIDKWLLKKIPVFKLLDPQSEYMLVEGDILYCYGQVNEEKIVNYLWEKKVEEGERNEATDNLLSDDQNDEKIAKHNKKIEKLIGHLHKRLIREGKPKPGPIIETTNL